MPESDDQGHFIVKHGLDALESLPAFIWRTGKGPEDMPRNFGKVKVGDRWIGYAFVESDQQPAFPLRRAFRDGGKSLSRARATWQMHR